MEKLITPPNLEAGVIRAFFTTKHFCTLGEDYRERLSEELCIPAGDIYMPVQKHTGRVLLLENGNAPEVADAVITSKKEVLIGVLVADCVPVILYDRVKGVAGVVHAGWRGTADRILENTIRAMVERLDSSEEDILVAVGPSIKSCSYEVGAEVYDAVVESSGEGDYHFRKEGRCFIDLATANKTQALGAGIPGPNLWQSGECTFCNPGKYYSYRYSKGDAGRQGGFIGMW